MSTRDEVSFYLNGKPVTIKDPAPDLLLIDYLRSPELALCGPKKPCGRGRVRRMHRDPLVLERKKAGAPRDQFLPPARVCTRRIGGDDRRGNRCGAQAESRDF